MDLCRASLVRLAVGAVFFALCTGRPASGITTVSSWEYDQTHVAVAFEAGAGEYLVAWEDHHWGFGTDWDIYARRLSIDGAALADPFAVSFEGSQKRLNPVIATDTANQMILVVWEYEYSATDHDIYARRIGSGGSLLGNEVAVAAPSDFDSAPAIAFNSSLQEYLVVWERRVGADEFSHHDIYAQRVSATGVVQGSAIPVETAVTDQLAPAVTYDRLSGEYLIVWQDKNVESGQFDIAGRRLAGTGTLEGGKIFISTWEYDQLNPRVAFAHSENQFLVVWEDHHWGFGTDWDIYGQRVNADGTLAGTNFAISFEGANHRENPDVAYSLASDEYVVVWEYEYSSSDHDVYRRRVANNGTLPDGETPVSSLGSQESRPAVATGASYAVAWEDGRNSVTLGLDIFAHVVTPPTPTPTNTASSTPSRTNTPTRTETLTPVSTPTNSATAIPTLTPTRTTSATPTSSRTTTQTPTASRSSTPTATPSRTPSSTPSRSATTTSTSTPTHTSTRSPTSSPSATRTPTHLPTPTPSPSSTPSSSATPTASPTSTATLTRTATKTPSASPSASTTASRTPTTTATAATPTPLQFRGFVYTRPLFDLIPTAGVQLALYGSDTSGALQHVLDAAASAQDGFYRLTWPGDVSQFAYYVIALNDAPWAVVDAIPGAGGRRTPDGRAIEYSDPMVAVYPDNNFIVAPIPTQTNTAEPSATPSATVSRTSSPTPTMTRSPTATTVPSATQSATVSRTASPTPTATHSLPTATPIPTASPPVYVGVSFGGRIYRGTALRRTPLAGVQVELRGAYETDRPGTLLAQTKTGSDGKFYAAHVDSDDLGYTFYNLVLSYPDVQVNDVVAAAGGEVRSPTWISFPVPVPPVSFDNQWYVTEPPPKLAVKPFEPVPAAVIDATFEQIQPIDFKIDGIELTQAIQCFDPSEGDPACADNSLPLVAGKLTAARVYISRAGPPPAQPQYPAVRVDLVIHAPSAPGGAVTMAASQQFKVPLEWDRTEPATTANFLVAVPFAGQLVAWASINVDEKWPDPDPANNQSAAVLAAVVTTRSLSIDWLRMDYRPDPSTQHPPFTGLPLAAESWVQQESLRIAQWLLPTAKIKYSKHGTGIAEYAIDLPVKGTDGKTTLKRFKPDLRDNFTLGNQTAPAMTTFLNASLLFEFDSGVDTLFAWFPDKTTASGSVDGVAEGAPPVNPNGKGTVALSVEPLARLLAHEVAHNLGLGHFPCFLNPKQTHPWPPPYNNCTSVEISFNPYEMKVHQSFTFMTYGGDSISPPEWKYLVNKLQGGGVAGERGNVPLSVLVSGWLTAAADGEFGPFYVVPNPPSVPDAPGDTRAEVRFLDGDGAVLDAYPFAPVFEVADGNEDQVAGFHFSLPMPVGLHRVQLLVDGTVVSERQASAHAPTVEWIAPAAGALPDGNLTLQWLADDEDEDELYFLLSYSYDGGGTWMRLASNLASPAFDLATDAIAGGDDCLFRVLASDGFLTGEAIAGPFRISRKSPRVAIVTPTDGDQLPEEQVLVLSSHADDPEDGALADDTLRWSSNRAGTLGSGATVIVPPLTLVPGWHEITAAATDSDASAGSATVELFVRARCGGDCDGDGQVTVDEIVRGVGIALGTLELDQCSSFDRGGDEAVTVDELVAAVTAALRGCSQESGTR